MQIQAVKQQQGTITHEQSLQAVKTLLSCGFGCITFLRGILPPDNFTDGHMTSEGSTVSASQSTGQQASAIKLKTVKRGYSAEGDKLLDYLEIGIFDALSKGYLKSFIFAVYLDPEDPTNVVECFTFNFTYHTIPGTDVTVPVLASLNDQMGQLSVSADRQNRDAQSAIIQGKVPTLGEVKLSVKNLIRRFIMLTQTMDHLPHRRFVTFKLFYVDGTPADYEPPHFKAADPDKDTFYFHTHSRHERPDKMSVGTIDTAFHGVSVEVSSISNLIPNAEEQLDKQQFGTLVDSGHPQPVLDDMMKRKLKDKETAAQKRDARARRVVWSAEEDIIHSQESLRDAEGTPDPEHVGETPDLTTAFPVGIRAEDGEVLPLSSQGEDPTAMDVDHPSVHAGTQIHDSDFDRVAQMSRAVTRMEETQPLGKEAPLNPEIGPNGSFHPYANDPEIPDQSIISHGLQTADLVRGLVSSETGADPILSGVSQIPETQLVDLGESQLPEENYILHHHQSAHVAQPSPRKLRSRTLAERPVNLPIPVKSKTRTRTREFSDGIGQEECCCETDVDVQAADEDAINQWCQCEGGCGRWYHLWCMGYLSSHIFTEMHPEGGNQTTKWICFDCSLQAHEGAKFLDDKAMDEKKAKFVNLAMFRRTLKTVTGPAGLPDGPTELRKRMGCNSSTAAVLWKRLENEGFIAPMQIQTDSIGLLHSATVETQKKSKSHKKVRKSAKRPKYGVVRTPTTEGAFASYFDPNGKLEKELMGFEENNQRRKRRRGEAELLQAALSSISRPDRPTQESDNAAQRAHQDTNESQTQLIANPLPPLPLSFNARARLAAEDDSYSRKRQKASVAQEGVDVEM